ncbi:MAG: hypothetical protein H6Q48_2136 [Deltaproteobacteria bacterium]|nr:hypothetical protein [Deltaproteobacteria bacterium]
MVNTISRPFISLPYKTVNRVNLVFLPEEESIFRPRAMDQSDDSDLSPRWNELQRDSFLS